MLIQDERTMAVAQTLSELKSTPAPLQDKATRVMNLRKELESFSSSLDLSIVALNKARSDGAEALSRCGSQPTHNDTLPVLEFIDKHRQFLELQQQTANVENMWRDAIVLMWNAIAESE